MEKHLLRSPDPADASSGASDPPAPAGATSAGKAKKPAKTAREIQLEIAHSKLEDENKALKGRLTEMEKWAQGLGKPAKAGKAGEPAPADAGKDAGNAGNDPWMDWDAFVKSL